MPPKAAEPVSSGPDPALEEEKELVERELVIGHLKSRLGSYQTKSEELSALNLELIDELETQRVNLKDINEFLTNEKKAKELATAELEQRVATLSDDLDSFRESSRATMNEVETKAYQEQRALQDEIDRLQAILDDIHDFQGRRERVESDLADKLAMLKRQRQQQSERIEEMERKAALEKDRLKKEMAMRIKDTKANMKKMTDNQLESTTKRTIMENEQMASELAYQARQTEKLLQRNEVLLNEHVQLRNELEETRKTEREVAKRNHVYQKTIKTLTTKLAAQEDAKASDTAALARGAGELQTLQAQVRAFEVERDQLAEEVEEARKESEACASEIEQGEADREECIVFLEACMADVDARLEAVQQAHEGAPQSEVLVMPGRLEELSLAQRRRALEYLLEKLLAVPSMDGFSGLNMGSAASGSQGSMLPPIGSADALGSGGEGGSLASFFAFPFGQGSEGSLGADGVEVNKKMVSAGVQTSGGPQPGTWQEAAAIGALKQTWSAPTKKAPFGTTELLSASRLRK